MTGKRRANGPSSSAWRGEGGVDVGEARRLGLRHLQPRRALDAAPPELAGELAARDALEVRDDALEGEVAQQLERPLLLRAVEDERLAEGDAREVQNSCLRAELRQNCAATCFVCANICSACLPKSGEVNLARAKRRVSFGSRSRHLYQWTKRSRRWRNGYPLLRMRTASKTPEYRSCSSAIGALNSFGRLLAFGLMQRMNIGLVRRGDAGEGAEHRREGAQT